MKTRKPSIINKSTHEYLQRNKAELTAQIAAIRTANCADHDNIFAEMFACIIDMSYLCWQRKKDIRLLKESQIANGYITFHVNKTSQPLKIFITDEIRAVINKAREIKSKYSVISEYLFSKSDGQPHSDLALINRWLRARDRSGIKEQVSFYSICALGVVAASNEGENRADLERRVRQYAPKLALKLPW